MSTAYKCIIYKEAEHDVESIVYYMSERLKNPAASERFVAAFEKNLEAIRNFPYLGRTSEIFSDGKIVRIKSFETYRIFYIICYDRQEISILRVLKDKQDWKWNIR